MSCRIVVIDDERDFLDSIRRGLIISGYKKVQLFADPIEATSSFESGEIYDIALIDITMQGISGVQLLELIKSCSPNTECIMISAINEAKIAVECLKLGAYDYLTKPVSKEDLILKIKNALERKRLLDLLDLNKTEAVPAVSNKEAFKHIVTKSSLVMKILKEAELHAVSDVPVLITGESGTGKELLARAVHFASRRARFPFMPVNMASLSANLFDAEFFGHTKGAFTGAEKERAGYLESTNGGTLFLDEIGTLSPDLQGKFLRVLQEGEFTKIGTSKLQKIDVRFVAATNEDLEKCVAKGLFRKDLYYRLKGAWLRLPPLRERPEDIPLLAATFLQEFRGEAGRASIDEEALTVLMAYEYPGNIRELKAIIAAAVNLAGDGVISRRFLPEQMKIKKATAKQHRPKGQNGTSLADVERSHILDIYQQADRNKAESARLLGIGINTLRRKLESYGEK